MDVGIIMDRSGSVGYADFRKSKNFVRILVHRFQISSHGTRVGIIAYQSSSHLAVKFSDVHAQSPSAMSAIIDKISYTGGGTRTDVALGMANSKLFSPAGGDRGDKPNVLVVITDGKTNPGSQAYSTVLKPLIVSMLFYTLLKTWLSIFSSLCFLIRLYLRSLYRSCSCLVNYNRDPYGVFFYFD